MTRISTLAAALLLSTAAAGNAAPPLPEALFGPPMGQIVNWAYFPHAARNFPTYSKDYTPTNGVMGFHKLYADTMVRCDVMVDAWTSSSARVSVGLFVDGVPRAEQSLSGAGGFITFGFGYGFKLTAGDHLFVIEAASGDGSLVTVDTKELGVQCAEIMMPPSVTPDRAFYASMPTDWK
jgi:hypothetical protein